MLTASLPRYMSLVPVLGILGACAQAFTIPVCNASVYCNGELLQKIQLARIFPDSKTFVDLKLVYSQKQTLADFAKLMKMTNRNPSREEIVHFVDDHFRCGHELESWSPPDFNPEPPVLNEITDPKLRQFAKDVISIWSKLGRKVAADVDLNSDRYSFLYVPNGFIIPGGRFRELYYWDSYWIIRGLLVCKMHETAKGMVENLLYLVNKLGYIPNGSRIYYLGRSQPPLLAAMVSSYFYASKDIEWLKQHIGTLEKELKYWLNNKKITVEVNGTRYMLLRYSADGRDKGPRPESYYEDYWTSQILPTEDLRESFYTEMKSAAESGWDFSTRWFVTAHNQSIGNLTDVHVTRIIPVDLNAIFAGALEIVGDLYSYLMDVQKAKKWWNLAKYWRIAIEQVMWDPVDGVWYDYDAESRILRKHFYPSCVTPLWAGAVEPSSAPKYASRVVTYLRSTGALDLPGGIPTSLQHSGEQWDYPNAWPPLQSIVIGALENSGYDEAVSLAREHTKVWIRANYIGYSTWQKMFEKYSAEQPGHTGEGGEYVAQDGFGWTNGVALELLQKYGKDLVLDEDNGITRLPDVRLVR